MSETMKYFVSRDGREYGPYTIEELRDYIAQGRVGLTEPAREARDGGRSFASVSEVLAAAENAPAPVAPPAAPAPLAPAAGASPYAAPATWQSLDGAAAAGRVSPSIPMPPDQSWGMLLLLGLVTCGIYMIIRMFQQAAYAKRIDPANQTTLFYQIYIGLYIVSLGLTFASASEGGSPFGTLLSLAAAVCVVVGHFKLRATLQVAFNRPLSAVMTFFFNVLYFQYHMHEVAKAMKEGRSI
ncbi:MAG: hypothetical protein JNK60_23550 [Acidobacteria bacterium]|nr:hypothetical protein [Acidobacteriota bacterium]